MDMRGGNINNIGRDVHNHVHNHWVTISIRFVWLNTVIYKCDADRNMIQWRQHDSVSQRGSKLAVFTDDTRSILVIFWIDGRVRRGSTVFVTLHFTRLSHGFKLVSNLHDWVPVVWLAKVCRSAGGFARPAIATADGRIGQGGWQNLAKLWRTGWQNRMNCTVL